MKDILTVHTNLKHGLELVYDIWSNGNVWITYRFKEELDADLNTNRLTIVGIPNEVDKTLKVGIAFCSYPDNFSRSKGYIKAFERASSYKSIYDKGFKPYAIIPITEVEFTQEACLEVLYAIHDELVKLTVKEVKKLVSQQIVK